MLEAEHIYNGNYIDIYDFELDPGTDLTISGSTNGGLNEGVGGWETLENSQVDFKIYWYGEVEVWFDKLTVDDAIANELLLPNCLFDYKIADMTTPESFMYAVNTVKERRYTIANIEPIGYVLRIMYSHLINSALPIRLKTP